MGFISETKASNVSPAEDFLNAPPAHGGRRNRESASGPRQALRGKGTSPLKSTVSVKKKWRYGAIYGGG